MGYYLDRLQEEERKKQILADLLAQQQESGYIPQDVQSLSSLMQQGPDLSQQQPKGYAAPYGAPPPEIVAFNAALAESQKQPSALSEEQMNLDASAKWLADQKLPKNYIKNNTTDNVISMDPYVQKVPQQMLGEPVDYFGVKANYISKNDYTKIMTPDGKIVDLRPIDREATKFMDAHRATNANIKNIESEIAHRGAKLTPITNNAGDITWYNEAGQQLRVDKAVGKQSGAYEKNAQLQKQTQGNLDLAINQIQQAAAPGGLIEKSTGSGIGAFADKMAAMFGQTTTGAQAIAQMRPIYDLALKMVPRFEGPQSDKDTLSYQQAAGNLADPTVPTQDKIMAAKTIVMLMQKRREQFIPKDLVGTEGDIAKSPAATQTADAKIKPVLNGNAITLPNGVVKRFPSGAAAQAALMAMGG